MRIISTSASARFLAAARPTNPAPIIATHGRSLGFDCSRGIVYKYSYLELF